MGRALITSLVLWPVLAAAQIPVLSVSPADLVFAARSGGPSPAGQLRIRNAGSGTLQWVITPQAAWIQASPSRGTGAASVTITIDASRLAPGRHVGRVIVDAGDADDSPAAVSVTVDVAAPEAGRAPSPGAASAPAQRPAPAQADPAPSGPEPREPGRAGRISGSQAAPEEQALRFVRPALPVATRNLPYSQAVPVAGGLPPYTVRVAAGRLPAGLTLAGGAVSGVPRAPGSFPITLVVTDSARPPATISGTLALRVIVLLADTALAVSPPSLVFTAPADPRRGPRLSITSGRQPLEWRASADVPWLIVTPGAGLSPALVGIGVMRESLQPGTHAATVTVTMEGAPNSPARVPITVTIPR